MLQMWCGALRARRVCLVAAARRCAGAARRAAPRRRRGAPT